MLRGVTQLSICALLAFAGPAVARPAEPVQGGGLLLGTGEAPAPVLASDVHIEIAGVVARVRLTQIFRNPSAQPLQAVYAFPLPAGAAVDGLSLAIGERALVAKVVERADGDEAGREALAAGRKTAVLTREGQDLFTVAVGAIPPGEEVAVVLDLQQLVTVEDGKFTLRFPMVAPAGAKGLEGTAGDAVPPRRKARDIAYSVGAESNLVNPFDLHVDLYPGVRLGRIVSPSHSIQVAEKAGPLYTVDLERASSADRDFVLSWEPVSGVAAQAALYTEEREGERYVLLMVISPAGAAGLSGVSVQWDDPAAETWPRNLPDLKPGTALVVAARMSKEASLAVISGHRGSTPWEVVLPLGSAAPGQAVDKLWARLQVEALSSGPRDERAVEAARLTVTELGLRYGLVTEYTSLVAEDTAASAADALPLRAWVPLAEPANIAHAANAGLIAGVAAAPGAAKSLVLASTAPAALVPAAPAPFFAASSTVRSATKRAAVRHRLHPRHRRHRRPRRRRLHHRAAAKVAVLPATATGVAPKRGRQRSHGKSALVI
jgi:hypothetical protein